MMGRIQLRVVLVALLAATAGAATAADGQSFANETDLVSFTDGNAPDYTLKPGEFSNSANGINLTGNLVLSNAGTTLHVDPSGKSPVGDALTVGNFTLSAGRLEARGNDSTVDIGNGLKVNGVFTQTGGELVAVGGGNTYAGSGLNLGDSNHSIDGTVTYRNLIEFSSAIYSAGNISFGRNTVLTPVIDFGTKDSSGNRAVAGIIATAKSLTFVKDAKLLPYYMNTHELGQNSSVNTTNVFDGTLIDFDKVDIKQVDTLTIGSKRSEGSVDATSYNVSLQSLYQKANASDFVSDSNEKKALDYIQLQTKNPSTRTDALILLNDTQNNIRDRGQMQRYASNLRDHMDPNKLYDQMRLLAGTIYDISWDDLNRQMGDIYNYIGFDEEGEKTLPGPPNPQDYPGNRPHAGEDVTGIGGALWMAGISTLLAKDADALYDWLMGQDGQYLANFFASMTAEQAAALYGKLSSEQLAALLGRIHPDSAGVFLAKLDEASAQRVLAAMKADEQGEYAQGMAQEKERELARLEEKVNSRPKVEDEGSGMFGSGLGALGIALLLGKDGAAIYESLSGRDGEYLANFFNALSPAQAAALYGKLSPEQLAGLLSRIHPDTAAKFLALLSKEEREAVIQAMSPEEQEFYAKGLTPEAVLTGVLKTNPGSAWEAVEGMDFSYGSDGPGMLAGLTDENLNRLIKNTGDSEELGWIIYNMSKSEYSALYARASDANKKILDSLRGFNRDVISIPFEGTKQYTISISGVPSEKVLELLGSNYLYVEYSQETNTIVTTDETVDELLHNAFGDKVTTRKNEYYASDDTGERFRDFVSHNSSLFSKNPGLLVDSLLAKGKADPSFIGWLSIRFGDLLIQLGIALDGNDLFFSSLTTVQKEKFASLFPLDNPSVGYGMMWLLDVPIPSNNPLISFSEWLSFYPAKDRVEFLTSMVDRGDFVLSTDPDYGEGYYTRNDMVMDAFNRESPEALQQIFSTMSDTGKANLQNVIGADSYNGLLSKAGIGYRPVTSSREGYAAAWVLSDSALASVAAFARNAPRQPGSITFWGSPFYQQSSRTASGGSEKVGGTTLGVTRNFGNLALGGQLSYSHSRSRSSSSLSDSDTYGVTVTARFMNLFKRGESAFNPFVAFSSGYSHQRFDNDRVGVDSVYSAKPHSNLFRVGMNVGNTWRVGSRVFVTPGVSVDYSHVRQSSSREHGSGAMAMWTRGSSSDSLRPGVGVDVMFRASERTSVTVRANYRYEVLDRCNSTFSSFLGQPLVFFDSEGKRHSPSSGSLGAGVSHQFSERVSGGGGLQHVVGGEVYESSVFGCAERLVLVCVACRRLESVTKSSLLVQRIAGRGVWGRG